MQFPLALTALLTSLLIGPSLAGSNMALRPRTVLEECTVANDCCISTNGACIRQATGFLEAQLTCRLIKICPEVGVPWSSCGADCCAISTGWGRGCPGK